MTASSKGVDTLGVALTIGFICVTAAFLNVIVFILTWRKVGGNKSAANLFIMNLSASDILLAGVTMPLILLDANIASFTAYDAECKLKMALPLFNIFISIGTMVLMSFDRLRVIAKGDTTTKHQAMAAIILTWVVALVLTAPQFYEYQVMEKWEEEENKLELVCSSAGRDATFKRTYAALVLILAYLLPVVFLTKNYIHVIVYVVKNAGHVEGQVSRAKVRVLRTIIVITVVFIVLWLPFFVLFTVEEVTGTDDSSEFTSKPHVVKQVFVSLSALSNPAIYLSLMPDYLQACRRLLLPARCCGGQVVPDISALATEVTGIGPPGQPGPRTANNHTTAHLTVRDAER